MAVVRLRTHAKGNGVSHRRLTDASSPVAQLIPSTQLSPATCYPLPATLCPQHSTLFHSQHIFHWPGVTGAEEVGDLAQRLALPRPLKAIERCVHGKPLGALVLTP
jgi:hypothetical protein